MDIQGLAKIIKAAQKGDSQARQALYLESSKSVYFLAFKILKNKEDAEDITQDVFVTVFEKLAELKQPAAYINWVNQITSNKCLNYLKKKKPMLVDEQDLLDIMDEDGSVDNTTPEMLYDNEETRRIIMEIIDKLPETQRVSVMLRYYSQLSIEEIAVATDTNEYTVKNRLATARKKIRSAILEKEEKDGIRLHVLIPIMPVLMKAFDEYEMPDGLQARMWENISTSLMAKSKVNTSEITQTASGQPNPMSAGEIQNVVLGSAGKGVTSMVSSKAIAIILSIIGGAAVITAAVIFYPQISKMFSFSNNMGEIIADVSQDKTNDEPYSEPTPTAIDSTQNDTNTQTTNTTDTTVVNGLSDDYIWQSMADMPETPLVDFDYEYIDPNDQRIIDGVLIEGMAVTSYNGSETRIRIPAEIDGIPVTQVGLRNTPVSTTVTHVYIPRSVTGILTVAFPSDYFMGYEFDPANPRYYMDNGVAFAIDSEGARFVSNYPRGRTPGGYEIPDGITRFSQFSGFQTRLNLTSVTIPASVIFIPDYAFKGCDNLKTVIIHGKQSEVEIQDGAFNESVEIIWVNG